MNRPTIADVNAYLEKARDADRYFSGEEKLCLNRYQDKLKHYDKYLELFEKKIRHKLGLVLTPIAHFAAVIWEGIVIQPLCYEWLEGVVSPVYQFPASILPAFMLYGLSLCIGHQFHQIGIERHEIQPGRFQFQRRGALITGLILSIGYVGFLYLLVKFANELPGGGAAINQLIVGLGLIELVLGYFAILGWEVIIAHMKQSVLTMLCRRSERRLQILDKRRSDNYAYYKQGRALLDENLKRVFREIPEYEIGADK